MLNISIVVLSYFFMEFIAWSNHKYIMHGFLWKWHKDHHRKDHQQGLPQKTEDKRFEKNDLFFLVYSVPAMILIITGLAIHYMPIIYSGIGISLYGLTYFIIHDIIIHNRLKHPFKKYNFFIEAIVRAHTAHHKPANKDDFNNFGLLIFSRRYFKDK